MLICRFIFYSPPVGGSKSSELSGTVIVLAVIELMLTAITITAVLVILRIDCKYDPDWPGPGGAAFDYQGSGTGTGVSLVPLPSTSSERTSSKLTGAILDNYNSLSKLSREEQVDKAESTQIAFKLDSEDSDSTKHLTLDSKDNSYSEPKNGGVSIPQISISQDETVWQEYIT